MINIINKSKIYKPNYLRLAVYFSGIMVIALIIYIANSLYHHITHKSSLKNCIINAESVNVTLKGKIKNFSVHDDKFMMLTESDKGNQEILVYDLCRNKQLKKFIIKSR